MPNTSAEGAREAFGRSVKRYRGKKMGQIELGAAIKRELGRATKYTKQSVVSKLEHGKTNLDVDDMVGIAAALGIEMPELLIAWAEEIEGSSPQAVPRWLEQRLKVLKGLDDLADAVAQATASFYEVTGGPDARRAIEAGVNELLFMPEKQRKRVVKLAAMLNSEEDSEAARPLKQLRQEIAKKEWRQ